MLDIPQPGAVLMTTPMFVFNREEHVQEGEQQGHRQRQRVCRSAACA